MIYTPHGFTAGVFTDFEVPYFQTKPHIALWIFRRAAMVAPTKEVKNSGADPPAAIQVASVIWVMAIRPEKHRVNS